MDGPYQPDKGHRFNFHKLILDPFATAITRLPTWEFGPARGYDPSVPEGDPVCSKVDDAGAMPKCVFTQEHFHWHEDRRPGIPGRRRSFMKHTCVASLYIPAPVWSILVRTEA